MLNLRGLTPSPLVLRSEEELISIVNANKEGEIKKT